MPANKDIPPSVRTRIQDMKLFPPEGWTVFDYYYEPKDKCELALIGREVYGEDDHPPEGLESVRGMVIDMWGEDGSEPSILFNVYTYTPTIVVSSLVDPAQGMIVTAPDGEQITLEPPVVFVPDEEGPFIGICVYRHKPLFVNNKQLDCRNSCPGTLLTYGQMYRELGGIEPEEIYKNYLDAEGTSPTAMVIRIVHPNTQTISLRGFPHLTAVSVIPMPGFTSVDVSYGPLCPVSSLSYRHACDLLWPAIKEGGDPRLTMGDAVTAIGLAGAGRRVVLHSESVAWRKEVRGAAGSITTRLCHLIGSSTAFDGATYRQLYPDVVSLQNFPSEVKNLDTWWGRVLNAWLMMLNAVATPHRTEAEQALSTLYGHPDDPTDFSAPPGKRHAGLLRDGIDWLTNQYNRYWGRIQYEVKFRGFFDAVRIHINESKVKPAKENIFSQALFAPTKFHFTGEQLAIIYREARNLRKFMRNAQMKVAQAEFQRNPVIEFGDIAVNLRELPSQPLPQFAQLSLREFPPLPAPEVPKQKMLDLPRMPFPPLPARVST